MKFLRPLSASEQVAAHLRSELQRGHWSGMMPGAKQLTSELQVNHKTIETALKQLEYEGLLAGQGPGRKRHIVQGDLKKALPMRVAILENDEISSTEGYMVELQHVLMAAGHSVFFSEKSQTELGMELARIKRLVNRTEADAWLICSGSRQVLEWFATQSVPAFALFGRREGLPIAAIAPDKLPIITKLTRNLIDLGHRRIVLVTRGLRRLPEPGPLERAYLDELEAQGIATNEYNLPDWEESDVGLHQLLKSLFQVTPPTALILDEARFFIATLRFFSERGIRVPQQVSLICLDSDPSFNWCSPAISHVRWETSPMIRRIVRWVANVSSGKKDIKQTVVPTKFIVGGTTGPMKMKR